MQKSESKLIKFFGPPIAIARGIVQDPNIDVYIFGEKDQDEFLYFTVGLDNVGERELIMLTLKQEKWPAYFLREVCKYQIASKEKLLEKETFDNGDPVPNCGDFSRAIFLGTDTIGLKASQLKKKLQLKEPPLYVLPITEKELAYAVKNGTNTFIQRLLQQADPIGDINRKSVV